MAIGQNRAQHHGSGIHWRLCLILGWALDISGLEWILQILAIGMVLVAESLNTAIEKLCDFYPSGIS